MAGGRSRHSNLACWVQAEWLAVQGVLVQGFTENGRRWTALRVAAPHTRTQAQTPAGTQLLVGSVRALPLGRGSNGTRLQIVVLVDRPGDAAYVFLLSSASPLGCAGAGAVVCGVTSTDRGSSGRPGDAVWSGWRPSGLVYNDGMQGLWWREYNKESTNHEIRNSEV